MTKAPELLSIALLAGGKSSRMGADKGIIPFMGKPLFQYILDQVHDLSEDIFLITNQPGSYTGSAYPTFTDKIPDIGALGGIFSALSFSKNELCLVLACDMPYINTRLIRHLLTEAKDYDVVIPQLEPEKLEPFRAIYRKSCLPHIEAAIGSGERRAIAFLAKVKTKQLPLPILQHFDAELETFLNINTPEDLVEIEALVHKREAG
jgi:molybdopterin-guanine dinucleotide biosynthesis protein A